MAILLPISYLLAALLFLLLAVLVAIGWQRKIQSGLLLLASLVSAIWAIVSAVQFATGLFSVEFIFLVEVARNAAWLAFLVAVLQPAGDAVLSKTLRLAAYLAPVLIASYGLLTSPEAIFVTGGIVTSLIGLALIERIYGSTDPAVRRPIAYLCLAVGGILGYDLVLFSSAVLVGQIDGGLWAARALANAFVVPFLAVAARRNRDWPVDMFVSRQVAYFSVTFFGAGIYLLLMAVGGYYVKEYGGDWGEAAGAILVFGSIILLVTLLLSVRFRRRAKVFFSKHFFSNRYDYREEWRDLTRALYHPDDSKSLGERSIVAAARIFDSRSGMLLQREGQGSLLLPHATWHREPPENISVTVGDNLFDYLESSQWVIDTFQYHDQPDFYEGLTLPDWLASCDSQQLIVPLLQESSLIGILILEQEVPIKLTYEDTDLLKIVGRQVAGILEQQRTSERLAESKQFQAYSRLTAFLMHDLKNLAAQQSLVVKNAAKHKRNPDFVDDAFKTIEHSVKRMNALISQLAERDRKERRQTVDLTKVLRAAVERTQDRNPQPTAEIGDVTINVFADRDRLFAVFHHLLRNAQDACDDSGDVSVAVESENGNVVVKIEDNGVGMDDTFIRERLFRPFESTKGVDGMGIGAYQAREYVGELNGELRYESKLGEGTKVSIKLAIANDVKSDAQTADAGAAAG